MIFLQVMMIRKPYSSTDEQELEHIIIIIVVVSSTNNPMQIFPPSNSHPIPIQPKKLITISPFEELHVRPC